MILRLVVLAVLVAPLAAASTATEREQEQASPRDACFIFLTPSADFSTVRVRADLALTAEEKRELAQAWDADDDGALNETEIQDFVSSTARVIVDPAEMGQLRMYVDRTLPRSITVLQSPSRPLADVNATEEWNVAEIRVYDFEALPPAGDARVLSGGVYARPLALPPRAVVEALVVTAPDGWVVWSLGEVPDVPEPTPPTVGMISPDMGTHYGEQQAHAGALDVNASYFVLLSREGVDPFAPEGGGEIPGPGAGLVVFALATPALARRRTRR